MPRATSIKLPELKMCSHADCARIATGFSGYCYPCAQFYLGSQRNALRSYSSRPTPRSNIKNPMGVEIECYNPDTCNKVTHVAQYVCRDASLPENGGEIKLCASENKIEDEAADTVQRSRIVGNKVNRSCGLHLHMQIAAMKNDNWRFSSGYRRGIRDRLYMLCVEMQDFMFSISPQSRKSNHYCSKLYENYNIMDHHKWITISEYLPTLEVRIHAGTMNPWKIKGWINAWKQVRPDIDKVAEGVEGWEDIVNSYREDGFLTKLKPNTIGYKYIKARVENNGVVRNFGFDAPVANVSSSPT